MTVQTKPFVLDIQVTVDAYDVDDARRILEYIMNDLFNNDEVIQLYGNVITNIEDVKNIDD